MDIDIKLTPVGVDEKEILRHLLEKYNYEFSQYDNKDVNYLGLYGYDYLDYYWTEKDRWAFFIHVNQRLAGFAMVNTHAEVPEQTDYTLAEFFVMHRYRGCGVGRYAAFQIFGMFHGKWQLKRHPKNVGSVHFWNKVIHEYTGGNHRYIQGHPHAPYDDGTCADVFIFKSPAGASIQANTRTC